MLSFDAGPSSTVDDAIAWFDYAATEKPWMLWVAFNAPHTPLGEPPAKLLSSETVAALDDAEPHTYFSAMIEAMDSEIGRLLGAIGQEELKNTYIIFLGDNGTSANVVTAPFERGRAKGTLYQGGVNVPLMIMGPGVAGGTTSAALANSVDLYATILDLAGTADDPKLDAETLDSTSLAPVLADHTASVRDFAYADVYGPQQNQIVNKRAIRNERYKLMLDLQNDTEELYDLSVDPYEHRDLLDVRCELDRLELEAKAGDFPGIDEVLTKEATRDDVEAHPAPDRPGAGELVVDAQAKVHHEFDVVVVDERGPAVEFCVREASAKLDAGSHPAELVVVAGGEVEGVARVHGRRDDDEIVVQTELHQRPHGDLVGDLPGERNAQQEGVWVGGKAKAGFDRKRCSRALVTRPHRARYGEQQKGNRVTHGFSPDGITLFPSTGSARELRSLWPPLRAIF